MQQKREGSEQNESNTTNKKSKQEPCLLTERNPLPTKPNLSSVNQAFKIVSWNVNGLKAVVSKNFQTLVNLVKEEEPDLLLLQEHKLQEKFIADYENLLQGYRSYWSCSKTKAGYAGVSAYVKSSTTQSSTGSTAKQKKLTSFFTSSHKENNKKGHESHSQSSPAKSDADSSTWRVLNVTYGMGDGDNDDEGRILTVEFDNMYVVNVYVPNSGMKLERLDYRLKDWNPKFQAYLQGLRAKKPTIVTGDFNVAHLDLDIYNYMAPHIKKVPGCTALERQAQTEWLERDGWVDAFRHFYPTAQGHYTYYNVKTNARADNRGLRLDYFILPQEVIGAAGEGATTGGGSSKGGCCPFKVHDCLMLHEATVGVSDHLPIKLVLDLS